MIAHDDLMTFALVFAAGVVDVSLFFLALLPISLVIVDWCGLL
jgi:hypothetical protein